MIGDRFNAMRLENNLRQGISFGCALAITISWSQHHSVLWSLIDGLFSWLYVIYFVVTR